VKKINLAAVGLGRAFALMAPTLRADKRIALVGAADPRPAARRQFETDFRGRAFSSLDELLSSQPVDVVYIATPHQFHAEHACLAAAHGKHVLVEKPMALSVAECRRMIDAARKRKVSIVVGHSHSFDRPIIETRKLIESGRFGAVRMITGLYFTDFLYRPRRPEELDSRRGGGVVFNQAAHHIDIARFLAGAEIRSVRAHTGAWDRSRPTEGAYSCQLSFANGAFASLVYSGYAHFDADEFCGWIAESGAAKDPEAYGLSRKALRASRNEISFKERRNYGGEDFTPLKKKRLHQHFGPLIVSCEKADLRPLPDRIVIYADGEKIIKKLKPPAVPRKEVIDELYDAVAKGKRPLHDGAWGMATLEACAAMQRSAREGKDIRLASRRSA